MAKLIMERDPKDNKYLHRDFHISLDNGLTYVGNNYGDAAVVELVTKFTNTYYKPLFESFEKKGLIAIKEWIINTYEKEEALDAVNIDLTENVLKVKVNYCPAVKYIKENGHLPSKWYIELTRTVNKVIAEKCELEFNMDYYEEETGRTEYRFSSKQGE